MEKNEELYGLKDTCKVTGLSPDLVRLYVDEFEIPVKRTSGNHRRFSKDDIDMLLKIKQKVQTESWSYKQVKSWLNGGVIPTIVNHEESKDELEQRLGNIEKAITLIIQEGSNTSNKIDSIYDVMSQIKEQTSEQQVSTSQESQEPEKELNWIQRVGKKILRL